MRIRDYISKEQEDHLKNKIGKARFNHSIEVAKTARNLASIYGVDIDKASVAAILHDCAKYKDKDEYLDLFEKNKDKFDFDIKAHETLYHGNLGKIIAKDDYGINDPDILDAIESHTMLREKPSKLEKIIFLADATEATRNYENVETIRDLSIKDLDEATLLALDETIISLIKRNMYIGLETIKARNYFLLELRR